MLINPKPKDIDLIQPIHVAGTKGKGSTSAIVSSILSQYKSSGLTKIGLYTSPHLRFVRERIQINNEALSEEQFTKYFFQTWDALEAAAKEAGHPKPQDPSTKPVYFRLLTLMAFHTYLKEQVHHSIIECGVGGEHDSTNILINPTVTGVTSLGIDHTAMLGDTIEQIAWHKGGIFKPNVPAYTVSQPDSALEVLKQRAKEKNTTLHVVEPHHDLDGVKFGLDADFQKTNASLAIYLAAAHLHRTQAVPFAHPSTLSQGPLPVEFVRGLEQVRWPGRYDIRHEENLTWYIDGAHTLESIAHTANWFARRVSSPTRPQQSTLSQPSITNVNSQPPARVLIFNQQTRAAAPLLHALRTTLALALNFSQPFSHVIFCTNAPFTTAGSAPDLMSSNVDSAAVETLSVQRHLAEAWRGAGGGGEVEVVRTVEEAIGKARSLGKERGREDGVEVLVTGSLHLVGSFMEVLERKG